MNNAAYGSFSTASEYFRAMMSPDSLTDFVRRVRHGLQQPKDTGEYKFARLQLLRLSAWGAAVAAPCLAVLILLIMAAIRHVEPTDTVEMTIKEEPLPQTQLDPVPEITPPQTPTEEASTANELRITDIPTHPRPPTPPATPAISPGDVAPTRSPIAFRSLTAGGDDGGTRRDFVKGKTGTPGEDAIFRALRWLKQAQLPDGSWDKTKPAMTGLAVLCFLGHGERPSDEEFGPTLQKGVEWLIINQEPDGHFKGRDGHDYSQPIAAYALCEAYNVIRNPSIRYAAERAMQPILAGQHPSGAWDYNCRQSDRDDLSYTGWCIQALKAAHLAKIGGSPETLEKALQKAADGVKGNFALRDGYGGFGYISPGSPDNGLTGVGTLALQLTGNAADKDARSGLLSLEKWTFEWKQPQGSSPLYYWYYITQAKFINGGKTWELWRRQYTTELFRSQVIEKKVAALQNGTSTNAIGYWDSPAASEHHDGRVMDTCLCTLMLEVEYRYLPIYNLSANQEDRTASAPSARVFVTTDDSNPSI
jgi:hypothetical protein